MNPAFSFSEACGYLYPRTSGPKGAEWTLEPTRRMLAVLGNPDRRFPTIHIGGSNGKGSVATFVAAALRAAGLRVGLFTSPHLVDIRERFLVDGVPIPEDAFAAWTSHLFDTIEDTGASFFEVTTAIALADFAVRNVDVAVIEVGLGGRLDSTNVIDPLVAAITNVSLEHTAYLGDSLEAIAVEKSGIAKSDRPLVVGEADPAVREVLATEGRRRGAHVIALNPNASYGGRIGLLGAHQRRNAAVAQAVLERLPDSLRPTPEERAAGFASAFAPARFQRLGRWIFDVAHNPAGVEALVSTLEDTAVDRPLQVLFGVLDDKNGPAMLHALRRVADRLVVTQPPDAPVNRVGWIPDRPGDGVVCEPGFEEALDAVQKGPGTILVTGSFYTVGGVMARLPAFAAYG